MSDETEDQAPEETAETAPEAASSEAEGPSEDEGAAEAEEATSEESADEGGSEGEEEQAAEDAPAEEAAAQDEAPADEEEEAPAEEAAAEEPAEEPAAEEPAADEPAADEPAAAAEEAEEPAATTEPEPEPESPPPPAVNSEPGFIDLPPPASVPRPVAVTPVTTLPAAAVNEITPSTGPTIGGNTVELEGDNLYRASIVRIGGEIARTVGASEPRQLRVVAPPHKGAGAVKVSVQNPGAETVELALKYTYEALPGPKIETVAPNHAAVGGGTEISISGKNFLDVTAVLVDGTAVEKVRFVDAENIEFNAPGGKAGKMVDVVVKNPDGQLDRAPRAFVYDERF